MRSLPEAMSQKTPFGHFSIAAEAQGQKVVVKTAIAFDKARITPAEYAGWRAFCEAADRAFAQRLVVGAAK